jgi:hypothetical protein
LFHYSSEELLAPGKADSLEVRVKIQHVLCIVIKHKSGHKLSTCISNEPNPPSESRILIKPSNPPIIDSIRDSTYEMESLPILLTYVSKENPLINVLNKHIISSRKDQ